MMITWGIGTLGPVTVLTATNALLLRFMTDIYGIAAGLGASLIAFSKLYDAFADIAMGVVSDRTRSRWGRRRPYLIGGAVLLAIALMAIFAAPVYESETSRLIYMGVALVFYATAYTVFNIPYMAMPAEMTRHYHERSELMRWRVYGVGLSIIIASFLGPKLLDYFGGGAPAYVAMAACFCPVVILAGVITFYGTRRAPRREMSATHFPMREQIRTALGNRPFLVLLLVKLVTLMSLGTHAIFPFFFQRILGVSNSALANYFLVQSVMMLAAPSLWLWVSRKLGKKTTFMIALAIAVPVWLSWYLATDQTPVWQIYLRGVVIGTSGSGVILMGQSLLPDTMEYDYLRTGLRREGLFAALYTTVEKLSGAIGVAVVGAILGAYGYVQTTGALVEQPASALWAIRFIMAFIPTAISLTGIAVLMAYRLDEATLNSLRKARPDTAEIG
jgi:GPH family glycoside/pentoside/hexuronide:cation symporter